MMRPQFAITREDPELEALIASEIDAQHALLICSGGCTPLHLFAAHPQMHLHILDVNPNQIDHFVQKLAHVGKPTALNVLNATGNFEGLFRILRSTMMEFVSSEAEMNDFFHQADHARRIRRVQKWWAHPYAMAPYEVALNDGLIHIMFGTEATQHAAPNSYVRYFANQIRTAMMGPNAHRNRYLQHIFLGHFLLRDAPTYYQGSVSAQYTLHQGHLDSLSDLGGMEFVSLSNILDWSTLSYGQHLAKKLEELPSGAHILIRQLNNNQDWAAIFGGQFTTRPDLEKQCTSRQRGVFYNQYRVLIRR